MISFPFLLRFLRARDGATAIEYALMASLVAIAVLGAITSLGGQVEALFETISQAVTKAL